jgi:ABC-2 type transport system ATP-binding protein
MMAEPHPIRAEHLSKWFGDKAAVADLTLTVERGEVFGFLGPNGAGKTTAVKMLLGLIRPTSGDGWLFGAPLGSPRGRSKVGFLPEHFRFHDWLKATEFLQLHADLYRMSHDITRRRIPELIELVGLRGHADKRLGTYSKGMLQRIGLAQALLNEPELVILDEPTSGLDPGGRRLVRDIIRDLRERGTTVFLNSHLLSEVEVTCDRVAFINHGEVVRAGSLESSSAQSLVKGKLSVEIRARPHGGWSAALDGRWDAAVQGLSRWSEYVRADRGRIWLTLPDETDLPTIARYLVEQHLDVYALAPQKMSLEDLFMELIHAEAQE